MSGNLFPRRRGHATANTPFHDLNNVLMMSHVLGWTEESLYMCVKLMTENIRRVARGATPLNLVTP
jgi:phosphoglycerate dehydrogenase-like enzyme